MTVSLLLLESERRQQRRVVLFPLLRSKQQQGTPSAAKWLAGWLGLMNGTLVVADSGGIHPELV